MFKNVEEEPPFLLVSIAFKKRNNRSYTFDLNFIYFVMFENQKYLKYLYFGWATQLKLIKKKKHPTKINNFKIFEKDHVLF